MKAVKEKDYEVIAIAPKDDYAQQFDKIGMQYIDIPVSRKGKNLFVDLILLLRLIKLYKREKPDLVHHFTPKMVIYGSLAAHFAGIHNVVNSITGLGYAFVEEGILNKIVLNMYHAALSKNSQVIFENTDDRKYFLQNNIVPSKRTNIIITSGVNTVEFTPAKNNNLTNKIITFTLVARMLWDKGIREFVEAAEYVKEQNSSTHFVLLGGSDNGNPKAVPKSYLLTKKKSGIIDWIDHVDNVRPYIDDSDVVVLPSYREGGPRSLIEGASMEKPLIATDVQGCREIVEHEVNGLLVPPKDVNSLADAMLKLAKNHELRYQMGRNGRKKVLEEFDEKIVIQKTLEVYKKAGLQLTYDFNYTQ